MGGGGGQLEVLNQQTRHAGFVTSPNDEEIIATRMARPNFPLQVRPYTLSLVGVFAYTTIFRTSHGKSGRSVGIARVNCQHTTVNLEARYNFPMPSPCSQEFVGIQIAGRDLLVRSSQYTLSLVAVLDVWSSLAAAMEKQIGPWASQLEEDTA